MKRNLFISLFLILFIGGYVYGYYVNWDIAGTIAFLLISLLVCWRRSYLGLKPWWGGPLKDIIAYFKAP